MPSPTLVCLPEDISIFFIPAHRFLQGNEIETIGDGIFKKFKHLERW